MSNFYTLADLGWQHFFQQQLSLDEWDLLSPARIIELYRSQFTLANEEGVFVHPIIHAMPNLTVGDWILVDKDRKFTRLLDRKTCFSRKAAGSAASLQLISSNVDTAFIVSSINEDFNLNRIERYLSLVNASGAEPVIILSKSDLFDSPEAFISQVHKIDNFLPVVPVNCLNTHDALKLSSWVSKGKTIAVLGSSGVGKSTLINTLLGEHKQSTGSIREDDDKGRHTTTSRSLIPMKQGGLILDTPGMRQIQLADCKDGISTTFSDIEELATQCQFKDCSHKTEPNCAVQQALTQGILEPRRLKNYLKLRKEEALNSASLAERRSEDKALGKYYKRTLADAQKFKGR